MTSNSMFHKKFTAQTDKAITDLHEACLLHGLLFRHSYTSDEYGDFSVSVQVFSEDENGVVTMHSMLNLPADTYNWTHQIAMLARHVFINGAEPFLGPKQ